MRKADFSISSLLLIRMAGIKRKSILFFVVPGGKITIAYYKEADFNA